MTGHERHGGVGATGTLDRLGRPSRAESGSVETTDLCVVVPVCEEPEGLEGLYREYREALESTGLSYEFLFVVEPWAREAVEALVRLGELGEPVRVLQAGQDVGESMLLRAAASHHAAPILVTVPPYPRVAPAAVVELVRRVEAGADLASARRDPSGESWFTRVQRRVFHWLLRLGSGSDLADVASGVRAMRRGVLEEVPLHGDFFRFLPVLAEWEGFIVEEVTVSRHRRSGATGVRSPGVYVRRLLDLLGLLFLVRFTRRPLRFFGLIGSFLSGVGGVILLVLFFQRLAGQGLADRPLLVLGVMLAVLGVQAVALGLLGEIIVHLDAADRQTYRLSGGVRPELPDGEDE